MPTAAEKPPRILIVEDEMLVSLFLADVVEDLGFEVVGPVASLREAVDAVGDEAADAALVDVSLKGGSDGVEVARALTGAHGTAIIFMSGHHGLDQREDVRSLAPAAILEKPCTADDVEKALGRALGGAKNI